MTTAVGPRRKRIDDLAVNLRGPDDADVVVALVHGAMDRSASFGRVARRIASATGTQGTDQAPSILAPSVLTLAHDRRGYAGSLGAGVAESIRAHAEDLATVLEEAGDRPLLVVGHSLGGTIALEAALHTLGDRNLIGVLSYESPRPWAESGDRGERKNTLGVARAHGPEAAAEHFYRAIVGEKVWERLGEAERSARRSEGTALVSELAAVKDPAFRLDARALAVPVQSAYGLLSPQHMRQAAVDLAEEVGGDPRVFPNSGHGAHLTHPGAFAGWVLSMVQQAPLPGR